MEKTRILLVDDEVAVTRTLALYLESTGSYDVRAVNHGREAFRAAHDFKPHVAILDLMMPGMDGTEVAERLQQDPELAKVPIIFLTALVKKTEAAAGARDIGGHPFLAKPVDPDEVVSCIERVTKR